MLTIEPLRPDHFGAAAALFAANYAGLRAEVPAVPARSADPAATVERLGWMAGRALGALDEDGRPAGYLAWWQSDNFRRSGRRGAYVPEWGHGAQPERRAEIYRSLYRAAATEWAAAGNAVHAISILAHDDATRELWFWNGFGLAVVDAARPVTTLDTDVATMLAVRRATADDAEAISALDAEHVRHYAAAPVFMATGGADGPDFYRDFIGKPKNSVWLALADGEPAGFMRFNGEEFDAVAILASDEAAFCDGLYVRAAHRGRRAAPAMLKAALDHYARLGLAALYTNFESFNPEAAAFWPRYFRPVCYSLMRTPEVM